MRLIRFDVLSLVFAAAAALPSALPAATIYTAVLRGTNEVPPNASTATGNIVVTLNGSLLSVNEAFSGLTGGVATGAHIHCCTPVGVNAGIAVPFTNFPAATSGTYNTTFDLTLTSTYTSAFLTASGGTAAGAQAALIAGLNGGQTYANIHDATFPGGEIRGQLAAVPEPGTAGMLLLGLPGVALLLRRRSIRR